MGKCKWTPAAHEVLETHWGTRSPEWIARHIKRMTGLVFTPYAVRQEGPKQGLDFRYAQGDLTIADAARELGVDDSTLRQTIEREGIYTYGEARARYIRQEDIPRLREIYPQLPEPTVSVTEAATRLNVNRDTVLWHIKAGNLKAHRRGKLWYVSARDLERFVWDRVKVKRK